MSKQFLPISVLLLIAFFAPASAGPQTIIDLVKKNYNDKTPFSAHFSLIINWKVRETVDTMSGRIAVAPHEKFFIETDKTLWVCNGQVYWQYTKTKNQVIIKRLLDLDVSQHPSQLILTYVNKYVYAIKQSNETETCLEWSNDLQDPAVDVVYISMWADSKTGIISKLFVRDKNGNESSYVFIKTQIGKKLNRSVFTFNPPAGAKILDMRD